MISKKKLRERLIDISAGAGLLWCDEGYYESFTNLSQLESVGLIIQACEEVFDISTKSRLRNPQFLSDFDTLDNMVNVIHNAIEFDLSEARK